MSRLRTIRTPLRVESPPALRRMPFFADISDVGTPEANRIKPRTKKNYYHLKIFPAITGKKGVKLEVTFTAKKFSNFVSGHRNNYEQ